MILRQLNSLTHRWLLVLRREAIRLGRSGKARVMKRVKLGEGGGFKHVLDELRVHFNFLSLMIINQNGRTIGRKFRLIIHRFEEWKHQRCLFISVEAGGRRIRNRLSRRAP